MPAVSPVKIERYFSKILANQNINQIAIGNLQKLDTNKKKIHTSKTMHNQEITNVYHNFTVRLTGATKAAIKTLTPNEK